MFLPELTDEMNYLSEERSNMNGFKKGDICKLLTDTSSHNRGAIGIVLRSEEKILTVYFEYEDHPTGCKPEWFKKVDIDWLYNKVNRR